MVDMNTGFGSYAERYLTEIRDELPKKQVLLYSVTGMEPPIDISDEERRKNTEKLMLYNQSLAIAKFNELVDIEIPINLDFSSQEDTLFDKYYGRFERDSLYHASAIPALAMSNF